MKPRFALVLAVLMIATVVCGNPTPTARPPQPQPTITPGIPSDHNERAVNGSEGTPPDGIPVDCESNAIGNINIPAGSFEGTSTIQIDCLSPEEQSQLDQAVENATGQTGEPLGAIKVNPSGMQFNSFVTITIPLLRRVDESEGDIVNVYVFQDDSTTIYETLQAPVGADCNRYCAKASVDHFTTFLAYQVVRASITCTDPLGCVTYAPGEPIRIASLLAFSSKNAAAQAISYDGEAGILSAIEAYGEILGHRIEYKGFDEACIPDIAYERAKEIVEDTSFAGVVGTVCSPSAESAMQILSSEGYSMVSPANTAPSLTAPGSRQDGYFRVAPSDVYEAQAMAIYAYQILESRYISVVYEGTENSKLLAEAFSAKFLELGGKILSVEDFSDPALYAERTKARIAAGEQAPNAIYMPMSGSALPFASLITGFEYYGDGVRLLGHSSMMNNDEFLKSSGFAKFITHYPLIVPRVREQAFDYGYDAAALLLEAIRSVAYEDADGTLYIGRQALRDAISATLRLPGRVGNHTCNLLGDCTAVITVEVYRYSEPTEFSYEFLYETTIFP
jgi:branched-chain amino acid transport system substrate-binding protein